MMSSLLKRWLLLSIPLFLALPAVGQVRVEVEFKGVRLVGEKPLNNDWNTALYAGLPRGALTPLDRDRVTIFETRGDLLLKARAVEEEDPPDYGEASKVVRLSTLAAGQPTTFLLDVRVREDRGRHRGIRAHWRFEVEVTLR